MGRKKKSITVLSVLVMIGLVFCFFFFQTPSLDEGKIDTLTIATLPAPPKQKTITQKEDIQKFVTLFNSLQLSPTFGILRPAGTTCWIKTFGETYTHEIIITGNILQFDKRTYYVNRDIFSSIQELYQSFEYPETTKTN